MQHNYIDLLAEPGTSTLNVLNYKYKYFPPRKYLSTSTFLFGEMYSSTFLFGEMYSSTFRVLSKCTFKRTIGSTFQLSSNFLYPENQTKFLTNQHYYDRKIIQTWGDSYSGAKSKNASDSTPVSVGIGIVFG